MREILPQIAEDKFYTGANQPKESKEILENLLFFLANTGDHNALFEDIQSKLKIPTDDSEKFTIFLKNIIKNIGELGFFESGDPEIIKKILDESLIRLSSENRLPLPESRLELSSCQSYVTSEDGFEFLDHQLFKSLERDSQYKLLCYGIIISAVTAINKVNQKSRLDCESQNLRRDDDDLKIHLDIVRPLIVGSQLEKIPQKSLKTSLTYRDYSNSRYPFITNVAPVVKNSAIMFGIMANDKSYGIGYYFMAMYLETLPGIIGIAERNKNYINRTSSKNVRNEILCLTTSALIFSLSHLSRYDFISGSNFKGKEENLFLNSYFIAKSASAFLNMLTIPKTPFQDLFQKVDNGISKTYTALYSTLSRVRQKAFLESNPELIQELLDKIVPKEPTSQQKELCLKYFKEALKLDLPRATNSYPKDEKKESKGPYVFQMLDESFKFLKGALGYQQDLDPRLDAPLNQSPPGAQGSDTVIEISQPSPPSINAIELQGLLGEGFRYLNELSCSGQARRLDAPLPQSPPGAQLSDTVIEINSPAIDVDANTDNKIVKLKEPYFVHVVNDGRYKGGILERIIPTKFLCATLISEPKSESKGAFGLHYADITWRNNYFFICNHDPVDGVIFLDGFKRDVGSDRLKNNVAHNDFALTTKFAYDPCISTVSPILNTLEEFKEKVHEIGYRRANVESDISDAQYFTKHFLPFSSNRLERIGKNKYNDRSYNAYHRTIIKSPELMHNECHVYTAITSVMYLGISKNFLEEEDSSQLQIKTLRTAIESAQLVNNEKKRLLEVDEPTEDNSFKDLIKFELSRIKTCLEKIVILKNMRDEMHTDTVDEYLQASLSRKASKKAESSWRSYDDSEPNRTILRGIKIDKIGTSLVILMKELKSYEKEDSLGILGLTKFDENLDFKDALGSQEKINNFMKELGQQQEVVKKIVDKIKVQLQHKVEVVIQDKLNPANLTVIKEDYLRDLIFKVYEKKNKSMGSFINVSLNDFAVQEILKERDINSLLYFLDKGRINLKDYKGQPIIHILDDRTNINNIKELVNKYSVDVNQKDEKGLTILDKMLPTCTAESLKELLNLGFKTSSDEAIDAILKSKKESVKQVIFENDELRNGLSIKSLKLDAKYNAFFEKLVNGNEQIVSQLIDSLGDYATNKKPSYEFKFDDNKITLSVDKIIDFLDGKKTNNLFGLPFFSYRSNDSEYKSLERRLNDSQKEKLKSSFDRAKNCSPHLCASLVIQVSPPLQQIRPLPN